MSDTSSSALPRQVADAYVDAFIELDPISGTYLGVAESSSKLPDFSPAGQAAQAELIRGTLVQLDAAERAPGADTDAERRCARLLRERLTAELAVLEADEGLRAVSNIHSPVHSVREVFTATPTATDEDWAAVAARLRAVPGALEGYRASLALGLERKLYGGRARPPPSSSSWAPGRTGRTAADSSGSSWPPAPTPCARNWTRPPGRPRRRWWRCGSG